MKYSYHPYHKYFSKRAQEEMKKLQQILPKSKIEHFGSTAIPGVGGKGIIDLYVSVPKKELQQTSIAIQKFGYEFKSTGGIPNERLFHQRTVSYPNKRKQTFHIHLTYFGSKDWEKSIAFRDFLRGSPSLAKEYSEIKHKAVTEAKKFRKKQDKKNAYMEAKKPVIDKIMKLIKF
jgi:GrpB-like predicted nucleotidyltransferase (UPF0157 family)